MITREAARRAASLVKGRRLRICVQRQEPGARCEIGDRLGAQGTDPVRRGAFGHGEPGKSPHTERTVAAVQGRA